MTNKNAPILGANNSLKTSINNNSTKSEYIQAFVNAGYAVFPTKDKTPIIKNWQNVVCDPFIDLNTFKEFNYGINLQDDDLVIDVDMHKDKDDIILKNGVKSLQQLEKDLEFKFSATLIIKTGGGGYHIFLKKPTSVDISMSLKEYPGLEFRSKGQYVVGVGSIHPDTNKIYTLYKGEVDRKCILDAPKKLLEMTHKNKIELKTGIKDCDDSEATQLRYKKYLETAPIAIQGDNGDKTTFVTACKGKEFGLSPSKTFELMQEHYNSRCVPPWDDEGLKSKVASAYKNSQNELGCLNPIADFKDVITDSVDFSNKKNFEDWFGKYVIDITKFELGVKYTEFATITPYPRLNKVMPYKGSYINVWITKKNEQLFLNFEILSNYTIDPLRNIINMNRDGEDEHILEIVAISNKGKQSKPILLDSKCKVNPKEAGAMVAKKGNFVDVLTEKQYKQILDGIYKTNDLCNKYIYYTPGLIETRNIWLYSDYAIDRSNGNIIKAVDNVIKINDNTEITLSHSITDKPYLNYKDNIDTKELASSLIEYAFKAYNNTIEPFLILGVAAMSPHVDYIYKHINGFPIVWSYGLSGGGKSSLFDVISCLYGFNKGFSQSGSSTLNKVWHTLSQFSRIPVMFEETSGKIAKDARFENDLKCFYDRKKRGRMLNAQKSDDQEVQAIPMFSSNNLPPQSDAVLNRLVFCTLRPDNFNIEEAKKFNNIRDSQLSNLLPEILKFKEEQINNLLDKAKKTLDKFDLSSMDGRSINNLSVALAGVLMLFEIAGQDLNENLIEKLEYYAGNHKDLYQTENAFDVFLSYLSELKNQNKIIDGKHYQYDFKTERIKLDHNAIYPIFAKEYRLITGLPAVTLSEILHCASQDKKVIQGKDGTTKPLRIAGQLKKCLEINTIGMDNLKSLFRVAEEF